MRGGKRVTVAAVAVSVAFATGPARAAEPAAALVTARLDWKRGAGARDCIDARALEDGIESRFGRDVFPRGDTDVVVSGRIGRGDDGAAWQAHIELRAADGTSLGSRDLSTSAPHCSALDDSLALALGLMLDVSRAEVADRTSAAAKTAPTSIRIPRHTVAPREPIAVEATLSALAAAGLLPSVAAGGELAVLIAPARFWGVELSAAWLLPQRQRTGALGADLDALGFAIAVCPLSFGSTTELRLCGVQRATVVTSEGVGFDRNARQRDLAVEVGVLGRLSVPVAGPLRLRAALGLSVPVTRLDFVYVDRTGAERDLGGTAIVVGTLSAGVGARF